MAMTVNDGGDDKLVAPVMNVTPLVDVVLVLLIIFMVITPLLAKKFWLHTPKQEQREVERVIVRDDAPLVLHLAADGVVQVNGVVLSLDELPERLRRMFAARADHVLFFAPDDGVTLAHAMDVLDRARDGGAVTIATLTTPLQEPAGAP